MVPQGMMNGRLHGREGRRTARENQGWKQSTQCLMFVTHKSYLSANDGNTQNALAPRQQDTNAYGMFNRVLIGSDG